LIVSHFTQYIGEEGFGAAFAMKRFVRIDGSNNLTITRLDEIERRNRLGVHTFLDRLVARNRQTLTCAQLAHGKLQFGPTLYHAYLRCRPADFNSPSIQNRPEFSPSYRLRYPPAVPLPSGLRLCPPRLATEEPLPCLVAKPLDPRPRRGQLIDVFA